MATNKLSRLQIFQIYIYSNRADNGPRAYQTGQAARKISGTRAGRARTAVFFFSFTGWAGCGGFWLISGERARTARIHGPQCSRQLILVCE
jgi:hypothetical protein